MEQFIMKTKVYMGESALEHLQDFDMERVFLICDPYMQESGMVHIITDILEKRQAVYEVFSDVVPDPDMQVVTAGIEKMINFKPDTLIALGGGSALDTAKSVRYICEHGMYGKKVRLIAIPTTSGTGSEVTAFAVISDKEKNVKYPLRDDAMMPDVALLDPELIVSVPASVTADTGMDVLTHAIEAFVSTKHCDFGDAFAKKAISLVFGYLPEVVKCGEDRFARERIHNASCMAGVAFNSTSLGLCHSMAHAMGARFHISHGRSNAMLLAHVIVYNGVSAAKRYVELADLLDISCSTDQAAVLGLARKVTQLCRKVGIPAKAEQLGISREEFRNAIPEMAETALADPCTETNPRKPTKREIEELYEKLI